MTRKVCGVAWGIVFLSALSFAGTAEFAKGNLFVTPQLGIVEGGMGVGANVEYGVTPNVGVGGTAYLWEGSVFSFGADGAYHFTKVKAEKFDLYAGGGLGLFAASGGDEDDWDGGSALYFSPFVGGRYFFSPKLAGNLKLNIFIVEGGTFFGVNLGVTIRLQ